MVRWLQPDRRDPMFTTAPASITRTLAAAAATTMFAGICLFGATAPAAATPTDAVASVAVSYSDLDLSNRDGRKTLDSRIVRAARLVCYEGSRDLAARLVSLDCVKTAVATARTQITPAIASAN